MPIALAGREPAHEDTALDGRVEDIDGGSDAYKVEAGCNDWYVNPAPSGITKDPEPVRLK